MPSKFMVSVVLDNATIAMWEALPKGERSKRIREALRTATVVNDRDCLIIALRRQIKHLTKVNADFRLYGTRIEKGDKLVIGEIWRGEEE
jgi:hypothetical protein